MLAENPLPKTNILRPAGTMSKSFDTRKDSLFGFGQIKKPTLLPSGMKRVGRSGQLQVPLLLRPTNSSAAMSMNRTILAELESLSREKYGDFDFLSVIYRI